MSPPVAIEVTNVCKSFRIPQRDRPTNGGRLRLPRGRRPAHTLHVLRDISFEVGRGEFFGVVGLNGSGKSTLLKLLCSTYAVDSGRIRLAGRLAPFLELGVGFSPDLAARENVVINGVMMGLTPGEARRRADEIIDFAGLSDHTDLQLKNYSSGMRVRLGFSVMTHVDADILLVDEVLAVGDAAFQERCADTFRTMHGQGRTIVLVTHSMEAIGMFCDRAMLLDNGRVAKIDQPERVANSYLEVNARALAAAAGPGSALAGRLAETLADPPARVLDPSLQGMASGTPGAAATGEPLLLEAEIVIDREIRSPGFVTQIHNSGGAVIHHETDWLDIDPAEAVGRPLRARVEIENRLAPGRYMVGCSVVSGDESGGWTVQSRGGFFGLEVTGEPGLGILNLEQRGSFTAEEAAAERP